MSGPAHTPARGSAAGDAYWMLVSSLPHLPHFDRATQLPIGPERLSTRLQMLNARDHDRLDRLRAVLAWAAPAAASPPQHGRPLLAMRSQLQAWQDQEPDGAVQQLVLQHVARMSLLCALREKDAGAGTASSQTTALLGPWAPSVQHRWNEPLFGLAHRMPWLAQMHTLVREGQALALQRGLDRALWADAEALRRQQPMSGSAVLAYWLQWRLLHDWLRHDAGAAAARLHGLALAALSAPAGAPA